MNERNLYKKKEILLDLGGNHVTEAPMEEIIQQQKTENLKYRYTTSSTILYARTLFSQEKPRTSSKKLYTSSNKSAKITNTTVSEKKPKVIDMKQCVVKLQFTTKP